MAAQYLFVLLNQLVKRQVSLDYFFMAKLKVTCKFTNKKAAIILLHNYLILKLHNINLSNQFLR
jgi:hypothetical protein